MDGKVSAEERLWCLIVALVAYNRGMSKHEIFDNVRGYRDDYHKSGVTPALDKMFENDKKRIKGLGIPLTTSDVENPADAVYSISESDYKSLQFSESEIALLTAAGAMWRDTAFTSDVREARIKLLAADAAGDPDLIAFVPSIHTAEDSYGVISEAIVEGRTISFPYLKPGETKPALRTVSPLSLLNFDGRWHLLTFDHDRDAERTFLLRRIVGKVVVLGPALRRPTESTTHQFGEHLTALWDSLSATVRVSPHTKAAVALRNRQGTTVEGDTYTVHYSDEAVFADELCEYGAEAVVLAPPTLRSAVIGRLERLVDDHA